MRLPQHALASAVVSGGLYAATRSPALAASSFLAGIFIDLDHVFDYVREYGIRPNVKEFFEVCHTGRFRRVVLPLHAWEWIPLLAALAWANQWNPWLLGLCIGFAQHLACDQIANPVSRWGYFFAWRLKSGFRLRSTFPNAPSLTDAEEAPR